MRAAGYVCVVLGIVLLIFMMISGENVSATTMAFSGVYGGIAFCLGIIFLAYADNTEDHRKIKQEAHESFEALLKLGQQNGAAIGMLRAETGDLETANEELQTKVSDLEDSNNTLRDDVNKLQDSVES
jgi:ABC-type transport system involved in multi-copper enzyme maturation permease subunit